MVPSFVSTAILFSAWSRLLFASIATTTHCWPKTSASFVINWGCSTAAVLIETLRQLKSTPHELYFVFSVQEEVGVRGATTAAFGIDPDLGLASDVTGTGDTPRRSGRRMEVSLGKGPAIKVRDGGMLADPRVVSWMVKTAEKAGLPYQLEILEGGSTDARAIQLTRAGVPAGCLSIPCRYVHSPSEMVDFGDVENAVRLLVELISKPVKLDERA